MKMSKKINKEIKFWENFENTIIDKFAKEEIEKIKRKYGRHRKKSDKKNNKVVYLYDTINN